MSDSDFKRIMTRNITRNETFQAKKSWFFYNSSCSRCHLWLQQSAEFCCGITESDCEMSVTPTISFQSWLKQPCSSDNRLPKLRLRTSPLLLRPGFIVKSSFHQMKLTRIEWSFICQQKCCRMELKSNAAVDWGYVHVVKAIWNHLIEEPNVSQSLQIFKNVFMIIVDSNDLCKSRHCVVICA